MYAIYKLPDHEKHPGRLIVFLCCGGFSLPDEITGD
jgi:hypothetical protein